MTTSDGVAIGATVHGQGPPLVLLQGAVGDGDIDWNRVVEHLTRRFTCHLPSMRGARAWFPRWRTDPVYATASTTRSRRGGVRRSLRNPGRRLGHALGHGRLWCSQFESRETQSRRGIPDQNSNQKDTTLSRQKQSSAPNQCPADESKARSNRAGFGPEIARPGLEPRTPRFSDRCTERSNTRGIACKHAGSDAAPRERCVS